VVGVSTGEFTGRDVLMGFLGKDGSLILEKVIKCTRMELVEIRA